MSKSPIAEFIGRIESFLERTGMAPSRLGDLACNDSAFVIDLRAGREPRFSTMKKVDAFMTEYGAEGGGLGTTGKSHATTHEGEAA